MLHRFKDQFERASFIERCAFKNLISIYDDFKDYTIYMTPFEGKDYYDVLLYKIKDGVIYNKIFIEIKVREVYYDDMFMETIKYNNIQNHCKKELYLNDDEYKIYYLNFTPKGTFMWDTKIIKDIPVTKQLMNKATMSSRNDKKNKSKYDLPISKAKKWNYIWDIKQLDKHYNEYFNKKVEKVIKNNKGLEDILFQ